MAWTAIAGMPMAAQATTSHNFNSEATARIYVVKNYLEIVDIFYDL